jgi:hypothetical protein
MDLSVIRYYSLRHKSNHHIQAKLCLIYGKVTLCPRTVDTWAVRFRSGMISAEYHSFSLFHSRRVYFNRRTSEKRTIQFCLLYSNNSSKSYQKHECASPKNTNPRPLGVYRQCYISHNCSVTSENRKDTVHQISPPVWFPWFGTLQLLVIQVLEKRTRKEKLQVRKPGDVCGDPNLRSDDHKLVLIQQTKQLIANKMLLVGLTYLLVFYIVTRNRNLYSRWR